MGKKAETEPSDFWKRLEEAWRAKGLPTSQNGVATTLKMSQGSTRRWHTGQGFPETDTLVQIATMGNVTIDWLLTGRFPKHPLNPSTPLGRIHTAWAGVDEQFQDFVAQTVESRAAVHEQPAAKKTNKRA